MMFGKYDADRLFSQYGFNQKQKNDETIINTAKAFDSNEYIGSSRNRLNSGILRNQFLLLLDSLNGKPLSNQTFSGVTQLRADQYVLVHQNRESELWEVYQGNSPNNPRKIYDAITLKNFFDSIQEVVDTTINDVKKDDSGTDNGLGSSLPNFTPSQIIYYGVPGCGKSNKIREQLKNVPEKNKVRVVFHPEYTNAEFIGQILPKVNGHVTYEFTPGPFTQIIKRAYLNPNEQFYLVIEEINRGNAAAIFGDTFQLLDRLKAGETDSLGNDPANAAVNTFTEGWSQYFVQNDDVNAYIRGNENSIQIGNIRFDSNTAIRLPPNLSILATMNTSDQNVFTLDNAFQRRFDMELVRNEFDLTQSAVNAQYNAEIDDTGIKWGQFWGWINAKITATLKGLSSTEDKRLGVWFVSNVGGIIDDKVFAEKVLKFLWDDVFKFKRPQVFAEGIDTLEKLINFFENPPEGKERFDVFKDKENLVAFVASPTL
ncbi:MULTISPECIES: AAA family ATPase [unclassified Fibrobacter]|uniref:AAA family ATPase n=1 Tax=unclassified Fibrobacter TaxID=2634177 RepID=UPI0015967464|nr:MULTISPECIES: AAA family ATPase [unclassified Fibrobacter]